MSQAGSAEMGSDLGGSRCDETSSSGLSSSSRSGVSSMAQSGVSSTAQSQSQSHLLAPPPSAHHGALGTALLPTPSLPSPARDHGAPSWARPFPGISLRLPSISPSSVFRAPFRAPEAPAAAQALGGAVVIGSAVASGGMPGGGMAGGEGSRGYRQSGDAGSRGGGHDSASILAQVNAL